MVHQLLGLCDRYYRFRYSVRNIGNDYKACTKTRRTDNMKTDLQIMSELKGLTAGWVPKEFKPLEMDLSKWKGYVEIDASGSFKRGIQNGPSIPANAAKKAQPVPKPWQRSPWSKP
jgi:hypothetical protein